MKIWTHASKSNPCPVCLKEDWCTFGDRAMLCQRVESEHAHPKGGWFHFYSTERPEYVPTGKEAPPPLARAATLVEAWASRTSEDAIRTAAAALGVSTPSLRALNASWAAEKGAWAFPMRDRELQFCGIRLRSEDGFKWAYPGSRQGLFVPSMVFPKTVYLPEGPTDTAACLTLGFASVGRPTCFSDAALVKDVLKKLGCWEVVIVADNDEMKRLGPREGRPGIEGAVKLREALGMRSKILVPPSPFKDIRQFVRGGGTAASVAFMLNQQVWRRTN